MSDWLIFAGCLVVAAIIVWAIYPLPSEPGPDELDQDE